MMKKNDNPIYGIKVNGCSIELTALSISDNQSGFEYICNVLPVESHNGNGTYTITILNKDFNKGLPIGKWTLIGGKICYNWGDSQAYFDMKDENGGIINDCLAASDAGCIRGFDVATLAKSIFPYAVKIMGDYPSAKAYNAVNNFMDKHAKYNNPTWFLTFENPANSLAQFKDNNLKYLQEYVAQFEAVIEALNDCDDTRSKDLLKKAFDKFKKDLLFFT